MYSLFNLRPESSVPTKLPNDWLNIANGLRMNLETAMDYYHTNIYTVESNHLLVNLLMNLNIPHQLDLDRYYVNVIERATDVSRVMGITSSISRGKVFNNFLFGNDSEELILSVDDEFDYEAAHQSWKTLRPINILRHPVSDLALHVPDGKKNGSDSGIAVISINIALLAVQYRAFRLNEIELSKTIPDYNQKSIMQFIRMYPLVNALPSLLDGALFNRVYHLLKGIPLGESYRKHPFYLTDWTHRVNKTHTLLLKYLTKNKVNATTILRSIPMLDRLNLEDYLALPDIAMTRQSMWLLLSARLRAIIFILTLLKTNQSTNNIAEINTLRKYFLRIKQNNQIITQLPQSFKYSLEDELNEVYELLEI